MIKIFFIKFALKYDKSKHKLFQYDKQHFRVQNRLSTTKYMKWHFRVRYILFSSHLQLIIIFFPLIKLNPLIESKNKYHANGVTVDIETKSSVNRVVFAFSVIKHRIPNVEQQTE